MLFIQARRCFVVVKLTVPATLENGSITCASSSTFPFSFFFFFVFLPYMCLHYMELHMAIANWSSECHPHVKMDRRPYGFFVFWVSYLIHSSKCFLFACLVVHSHQKTCIILYRRFGKKKKTPHSFHYNVIFAIK